MGDREIKQFNRVLFARFGNRTQELHAARLRGEIKSVVDCSPPHSYTQAHDHRRRVVRQKWADEQSRIEYENMLLLSKMRVIMAETQNKQFIPVGAEGSAQGGSQSMLLGSSAAQREGELSRGSLNREARIREMRRILHENENLLSRIQSRPPTYNVAEWEREHLLKEKQLASMGRFRYQSNTLPPAVMQELRANKPLKRYGTARFPVTSPSSSSGLTASASAAALGRALSADGVGAGAGRGRGGGKGFVFDGDEMYDEPSSASASASGPFTPQRGALARAQSSSSPGALLQQQQQRVHHLPKTEEKQSFSAGKVRGGGASSSAKKKQQHTGSKSASLGPRARSRLALESAFPPVEVELQLEHLAPHLPAAGGAVPRVILYVRNDLSGEYVPLSEVGLEACPRGAAGAASTSFRGSASVPGIDSTPGGIEAGADRRVRLAVFSPTDPAFTAPAAAASSSSRAAASSSAAGALRVPVDNTHLLGEARFSLAHFLTYPKALYKLKVLKHGLPIAGPAFGTVQPALAGGAATPAGSAGLSSAEVERCRALPEAILVLRHSNRPEPLGDLPLPREEEEPRSRAMRDEKARSAEQERQDQEQEQEEQQEDVPDVHLKFAATGLPDRQGAGPGLALFVFAGTSASREEEEDAQDEYAEEGEEELVGHTEVADAAAAAPREPVFHSPVPLGQWGSDPSRPLRLALYQTGGAPEQGQEQGPERGALLGEVRVTVGDLLAHVHNNTDGQGHSVWRLPLTLSRGGRDDGDDEEAEPESHAALLLRVEDLSLDLTSQEQWASLAHEALRAERGDTGDDDGASTEAGGADADPDPALERLLSFLRSSPGRSLWAEEAAAPSELDLPGLARALLASSAEGGEEFLYAYFAAVHARHQRYRDSGALVAAVAAGAQTMRQARDAVRAHLLGRECTLLRGDDVDLSDAVLDEMLSHADLALSPLAPLCAANRDEALGRMRALQSQGLTFTKTLHLAAALRKEGKKAEAAAQQQAQDPAGAEDPAEAAAATKIQALQRGRATRKRVRGQKSAAQGGAGAGAGAGASADPSAEADAGQQSAQDASAEEHAAATRIQAVQRGRMARAKKGAAPEPAAAAADGDDGAVPPADAEAELAAQHAAATRIQAIQRGRAVRAKNKKDEGPAPDVEIELGPSAEQHAAAERIQALQRGRAVRAKKKKTTAQEIAAAEAEAEAAKAAAAEAAAKAAADAQAAAERAEQAAVAAADALAAKEQASLQAAAAAAEASLAAAALSAKKSLADALSRAEAELQARTWNLRMLLACTNLPLAPASKGPGLAGTCHPMVAIYAKDAPARKGASASAGGAGEEDEEDFTFISQSERVHSSRDPLFAEALVLPKVRGGANRQTMFSVYNVGNEEEIGEDDVIGTALLDQKELTRIVARVHAGQKFDPVSLPIVHEGAVVPLAKLVIVSLSLEILPLEEGDAAAGERQEGQPLGEDHAEGAPPQAAAASADADPDPALAPIPENHVGIWVSLKDLLLPPGTQCNALAALYTKDASSANYAYSSQTDPVPGGSPAFPAPLVVALPAPGEDTGCMVNVYNHVGDDAGGEVSDAAALGACLFSVRKLLDAPGGALRVPLVKEGVIRGQVILKSRPDASSNVPSRPASAANTQPATRASSAAPTSAAAAAAGSSAQPSRQSSAPAGPRLAVYDLALSCAQLPSRPGKAATDLASPMLALYAQDPATEEFGYLGQTEKLEKTNSPAFESRIRIDEKTGGGPDGDRALMIMVYDVQDEENIQEDDQIGTCALTWKFLKDQATATKSSVTLPLLDNEGEQHPTATITIAVQKVQ